MQAVPKINLERLLDRLNRLAAFGAGNPRGVTRLALSEEERHARDQVVAWMSALGLLVEIDAIGNIFATRRGRHPLPPVMTGSHIDSVANGGHLDGPLGILAGIEVLETLNERNIETDRPLTVAVFTNEEGVRFSPDMMGSLVYSGGFPLEEALEKVGIDGVKLGTALQQIGYAGHHQPGFKIPASFVELHIEQGPVLEAEGCTIGAVTDLLGISWQELEITGQANHAGTTPLPLRHDAGYVAARINVFVRQMAQAMGGSQRATCGRIQHYPNLINVIPGRVTLTVDLRNHLEDKLQEAESRLAAFLTELALQEGVSISSRRLVRFQPVRFDRGIAATIRGVAEAQGYSVREMTSGAGHDAQMMTRLCPAAMIFVPSINGVSHNPAEATADRDLEAGANVLLETMLRLATESSPP